MPQVCDVTVLPGDQCDVMPQVCDVTVLPEDQCDAMPQQPVMSQPVNNQTVACLQG